MAGRLNSSPWHETPTDFSAFRRAAARPIRKPVGLFRGHPKASEKNVRREMISMPTIVWASEWSECLLTPFDNWIFCLKWIKQNKTVVESACPSASTVILGACSDIGPDMERISLFSLFPVAVTGPQPSGPTRRARTVTQKCNVLLEIVNNYDGRRRPGNVLNRVNTTWTSIKRRPIEVFTQDLQPQNTGKGSQSWKERQQRQNTSIFLLG